MEPILEAIRQAVAPNANDAARATGVAACRSILAALEPGAIQSAPAPLIAAEAMPQLIAMLKKMDLNQLLDVAIERLRALNAAKPSGTADPAPRPINFQLVPVPRVPR